MTIDNKRCFINILRGLAIFFMLWGHSIQYFVNTDYDFFENIVFKTIYSFHMPFFMLISGYLFYSSFKKRNLKELLVHKSQNLLQPIVFGTIIFTATTSINDKNSVFEIISNAFISHQIYWFLWSNLACILIVGLAFKLTKNKYLQFVLLLAFSEILILFPCYTFNIYMFPYFLIGFLYAKLSDVKIKKIISILKYLSIPLFPVMLLFFNRDCYIYTSGIHFFKIKDFNGIYTDFFRWAIGLAGCVFIITITETICKFFFIKRNITSNRFLVKFGEKSLQIYLLQKIILEFWLPKIYTYCLNHFLNNVNILTNNMTIYNLIITPIIAILVGIISLLIIKILEKTKISIIIFGR